ncbi:hypothetical protein ACFFX0_12860 [Citricoccus parietis]|uniref:Uncharacterized protein n=1 Tax=Citricoccus parietis TaxID=592307 RepID=A0ABV5FZC9_9MICC
MQAAAVAGGVDGPVRHFGIPAQGMDQLKELGRLLAGLRHGASFRRCLTLQSTERQWPGDHSTAGISMIE